ncbi:uncharacterized protein LOC117180067 [Belonocnema kinseyi]|uniref:uncharacterized protein LOC117180067 n=1 Tax=Belonocnema kinseyi TaxID=2817044 RepID=UPI00143CDB8E|nr:uncharacterized protein LOC117180067 [Belonocnema kinseyi]
MNGFRIWTHVLHSTHNIRPVSGMTLVLHLEESKRGNLKQLRCRECGTRAVITLVLAHPPLRRRGSSDRKTAEVISFENGISRDPIVPPPLPRYCCSDFEIVIAQVCGEDNYEIDPYSAPVRECCNQGCNDWALTQFCL